MRSARRGEEGEIHPPRLALHLFFLAVLAAGAGAFFLQEPLLGDDLTYWGIAARLHELGLAGWQRESFYQLRWPVWGVCWILQGLSARGMVSYWGVSLLYLAAGAVLAFTFARWLTRSLSVAWLCGLAFVFHPFLDAVFYCPMPDLPEAVWQAATMWAWWKSMHAATPARASLFAGLAGLFVFVTEANRVTGVFILPVLIVATLLFFRGRFFWLVAAGFVALLFYAAQTALYHHLSGDWLHDLTANALNRGAFHTELAHPWLLPFRFLDSFWRHPLARIYSVCALAGIVLAWRRGHVLGRVLSLWLGLLLLEYSCALQSLSPLRALVHDGERFLSCLALPMSALALFGLWQMAPAPRRVRWPEISQPLFRSRFAPCLLVLTSALLLSAATARHFFNPGFIPEFRDYLASVPDGASIFTHSEMRDIVKLLDPAAARRFRWVIGNDILPRNHHLEEAAARCDEFWYARKLAWVHARQRFHRDGQGSRLVFSSYLGAPEKDWKLARAIVKGGSPELVFYRRRLSGPAPTVLESDQPAWNGTALPTRWERGRSNPRPKATWPIAEEFRGRMGRLEFNAASDQVEPFTARLRFLSGTHKHPWLLLIPYLLTAEGKNFFALQIPPTATACEIELRMAEPTEHVEFTHFRVILEN